MHVSMYACMYVFMCMYVCMHDVYACMSASIYVYMFIWLYVCMYVLRGRYVPTHAGDTQTLRVAFQSQKLLHMTVQSKSSCYMDPISALRI